MRPTSTRRLHATIFRAKQPLFEEWVRPLNKKQQKVMNKAAVHYGPQYHGAMKRDVRNVLAVYEALPSEQRQKAELKARVEDFLNKHAGARYQLGDISPSTYGLDLHSIPSEFVIVDTQYPHGIPPNNDIPSCIAYDIDRLTNALRDEGFMLAPPVKPISKRMANPLGYLNAPTLQILDPQPFTLTLPNPAVMRTAKLLAAYFGLSEAIHNTFRSAYVWVRSHGLDKHVTPMTLALAVVAFCQLEKNLPSLSKPRTAPFSSWKDHPLIWVPLRAEMLTGQGRSRGVRTIEKRVAVDTSFAARPDSAVRERPISGMLGGFFGFWGDGRTWFSDHIVSLHSASLIPRRSAYLGSSKPDTLKRADGLGLTSPDIGDDFRLDANIQPKIWAYQPLVIADPFLITYNHAANLSPNRWSSFSRACLTARETIITSNPFVRILGNHYPSARDLPGRRELGSRAPPRPASALPSGPPGPPEPRTTPPPPYQSAAKGKLQRELLPHLAGPVSRTGGSRAYHTSSRDEPPRDTLEAEQAIGQAADAHVDPEDPLNLARHYPMLVSTVGPERLRQREEALRSVREAVRAKYGPRYDVEAFGSTQYGVSSNASDVDMVITDSENPLGFPPTLNMKKLPDVYMVKKLGRVFAGRKFKDVSAIPYAKVPIVRLRHPTSLIQCDINVNDQLGLMNTQMIAAYMRHVPLAAPILRFVKLWAKPLKLNMPSTTRGGFISFSTYAFALMVVGFLQHKGYAPNLQAGFARLPKDATTPGEVFWCKGTKSPTSSRIMCDTRWRHPAEGWTPAADYRGKSIEQHLAEFFQYWAREHDYANDVVDIKLGGIMNADMRRSKPTSSSLQPEAVDEDLAEQIETHEKEMVASAGDADVPQDENTTPASIDPEPKATATPKPQRTKLRAKFPSSPLCVVDPFIRNKNVTQNIGKRVIDSFRANANSVVTHLRMGMPLSQITSSLGRTFRAQSKGPSLTKSKKATKPQKSAKRLKKMAKRAAKKATDKTKEGTEEKEGGSKVEA